MTSEKRGMDLSLAHTQAHQKPIKTLYGNHEHYQNFVNERNATLNHSNTHRETTFYQGQSQESSQGPPVYATVSVGDYFESPMSQQVNHESLSESFLLSGGNMVEEQSSILPSVHTIRAAPISVQWLQGNYEQTEGVSLPRSTLYNHYLSHCCQCRLDPMNPASFGKLIRSVFPGLRTRRLGTRGNSQYHYYGIRIKSDSSLNHQDFYVANRSHGTHYNHYSFPAKRKYNDIDDGSSTKLSLSEQEFQTKLSNKDHLSFIGQADPSVTLFPHQIQLPPHLLSSSDLSSLDVQAFQDLFKEHCDALLELISSLQFSFIETLWQSFWRNLKTPLEKDELEERLPKTKLYKICALEDVCVYVGKCENILYQHLIEILLPDVLSIIPNSLTISIRHLSKNLTTWMKGALTNVPVTMAAVKMNSVECVSVILRRMTSLSHLSLAARSVLQNQTQVSQMFTDINKIDFKNIQDQACWMSKCEGEMVSRLEKEFKEALQHQFSIQQWTQWLVEVINLSIQNFHSEEEIERAGGSLDQERKKSGLMSASKNFLLKWSFYSSMIIRDLTLRSASSFGSFHLIKLFFDEFIYHKIQIHLASSSGVTCVGWLCQEKKRKILENGMEMTNEKGLKEGSWMEESKSHVWRDISKSSISSSGFKMKDNALFNGVVVKKEKELPDETISNNKNKTTEINHKQNKITTITLLVSSSSSSSSSSFSSSSFSSSMIKSQPLVTTKKSTNLVPLSFSTSSSSLSTSQVLIGNKTVTLAFTNKSININTTQNTFSSSSSSSSSPSSSSTSSSSSFSSSTLPSLITKTILTNSNKQLNTKPSTQKPFIIKSSSNTILKLQPPTKQPSSSSSSSLTVSFSTPLSSFSSSSSTSLVKVIKSTAFPAAFNQKTIILIPSNSIPSSLPSPSFASPSSASSSSSSFTFFSSISTSSSSPSSFSLNSKNSTLLSSSKNLSFSPSSSSTSTSSSSFSSFNSLTSSSSIQNPTIITFVSSSSPLFTTPSISFSSSS